MSGAVFDPYGSPAGVIDEAGWEDGAAWVFDPGPGELDDHRFSVGEGDREGK